MVNASGEASIVTRHVQHIRTMATPNTGAYSAATRLLNPRTFPFFCIGYMGQNTQPFYVDAIDAPQGFLTAQCVRGSNVMLNNTGARCLQVWYPNAQRVTCSGNSTIEMMLDPTTMPSVIDVSGLNSWGTPGRNRNNTRILVHISVCRGASLQGHLFHAHTCFCFTVYSHCSLMRMPALP